MEKRLEAELISIAHRILKLKNKSEVDQLYKETRKLYETLSVLKFYHDNFEMVKHDVDQEVLEEKLFQNIESAVQSEVIAAATATVSEPIAAKHDVEEKAEIQVVEDESFEDNDVNEEKDHEDHEEELVETPDPAFESITESTHEEEEEDVKKETETPIASKPETKKVYLELEELLGENYTEPVFVKPHEVTLFSSSQTEENKPKSVILNDTLSKTIDVGLNDKIAFVKHLFGNSTEDFNRVISQLNTFDSFEEAKNFINEMVIPDYNYWVGEEEYIQRFMEIVEKKFL